MRLWERSLDEGGRHGDERRGERRYNGKAGSWQSQALMWRGMAPHEETRVGAEEGTRGGRDMEPSKEPFMAPSGQGLDENIGECRVVEKDNSLGLLLSQVAWCGKVAQGSMEREGEQSRSRPSPVSMEDNREGCHCSKCGGRSDGGSSKEHAFSTPLTEEADEQGEAWFKQENSAMERSLMWLERELEAALNFEHMDGEDGGPRVNPIWITRILLGRQSRERQALGRAVKMYARFQRREFMRSLVKISDLEELAEPSLSGEMRASSSATYKGDAMDVDESVVLQEEARLAQQLSPGGGHDRNKLSVG